MALASGTRIGHYDIVSLLGAGGMGEVYRARDTRLNRDVALKIVPEHLAGDPDRVSRFTREAQVLASLNHAAIAAIYGLEDGRALVMELVDGPTLAERIMAGPMPIDEVIAVAKQMIDGLEAAHELGIIHRDLKPANIKVRSDGTVKILDFGLAKIMDAGRGLAPTAMAQSPSSVLDVTQSPTIAIPLTMTGALIIDTAPYMAPEQARGRAVDRRVDIWAFGCVLFEMLTGERAFPGDDVTDVLAKIIEREPSWSVLPATTPPHLRQLLRRALDKDPKTRLRDIGEARIALTRGPNEPSSRVEARPPRRVHQLGWVLAAVVTIALGGSLFALWRAGTPIAHQVERYDVAGPAGSTLSLVGQSSVTIAPDGRTIVFAASTDGITRLYVRHRDDVELRAIAGSEGASSPVFSPDGQWVAFVSGTELKKTTLDGPPVTLGKVADHRGIAWLDNQTIVFAPFAAGGLSRISASGGEPQRLTRVDSSKGERTHRWPTVLPGGAAVLFTVGTYGSPDSYENSRVDAFIMATGERRTVFEGASVVRYLPGRLVFSRGGLLYAVAFDAASLAVSGTPTTIARGVGGDVTTGAVHFAVSEDGTLVYIPDDSGGGVRRRVTWVGPTGAAEPLSLPPNAYNDLRISPDDSRMAVVVGASGSGDIWIHDFRRATFTRLTFDTVNASPIWSKDGQYVYFAAIDASGLKTTIKRRGADGGRDTETLGTADSRLYLRGLTSDETAIFADDFTRESDVGGKRAEVALVSLTPTVKERIIVSTPGDDFESSLAPNGRWFAYSSDESGRAEIYVRDLSNDGGRWQVSTTGGQEPRWSPDSRTLYYRFENRFIAATVTGTTTFGVDTPRTLFAGIYNLQSATNMTFDVEHSGRRFLMVRPDAEKAAPPTMLRLVLNGLER